MIPGLGADERLFEPQRAAGFDFDVADLSIPAPREDLPAYARRLGEALDLHQPSVLVGVSFGGILGCELARAFPVRGLVLVASCRGPEAIPSSYAWATRIANFIPDFILRYRCAAGSAMLARIEGLDTEARTLVNQMAANVSMPFLRGVGRMTLSWPGAHSLPCPVFHIHGLHDRVIPIRGVRPDEVIADGGHLISLTHAHRVNAFIEQALDRIRDTGGPAVPPREKTA